MYPGVLADECSAFRTVLALAPGARVANVGAELGVVGGVGGGQLVERTFDDVRRPDIVVVPGGLGCDRAADDLELRAWLVGVAAAARFVVASSTGTIVLAAAGLLEGRRAATHWLAAEHLDRYGVAHGASRLEISGSVITCEGRITAVAAAYAIVERCHGADAAAEIRRRLEPRPAERHRRARMIELVTNDRDRPVERRRRRAMR